MPNYYYEFRRQQAAAIEAAAGVLVELGAELELLTGRRVGLLEEYRLDGAATAIVALGSSAGTVKDVVDDLRELGEPVGLLRPLAFRPFPGDAVAAALREVDSVVVLDRADSPGGTPPLRAEVAACLYGSGCDLHGSVYGLGGRDLHPEHVRAAFAGPVLSHVGLRGAECPA
jgi:pyruvate ferredoxin oxidoreductase alpha subunit